MTYKLELHTKLSNLFHIGFNFITAENTPKPKWRTNRKYRLTRGEFVKRYSDELTLLGVSFGTTTKYFMIDIDYGSQYHPDTDSTALPKLRQILESIGIVRTDLIRSSHSQGIHLYGCLPKNVSTIRLATLLHVTFIDAGIHIIKGQLECFPNPKPYGEKGFFTYYNPHRAPLQAKSGSLLLDEDGKILLNHENLTHENMLAAFLARTEQSAQAQDMELLSRKMDTCYAKYTSNKGIAKYQQHHKDYTEIAREWKENLEWTIQIIGWTAHGQTNTLLPNFIAYGVVFLGLKGEELKDCLHELILTAPGYHEFCRHQHEIKAVIKGWVENTERQGYYLEYCGFPARSGLNPHLTAKHIKATHNQHNHNLAKRTEQRINAILTALTEIPKQITAKIAAIRTKSIELFGEAISRNTLYKPAYKWLWFGAEIAKLDSNLEKDPTPPPNSPPTITHQHLQPIALENNLPNSVAQTQSETNLSHTPPLYETYVGQVQSGWLHHQLQLHCINLFCQSIFDIQSLSIQSELELDLPNLSNLSNPPTLDPNLQSTSVTLEIQNLPVENIHATEDFNDDRSDLQFEEIEEIEEIFEVSHINGSSFELESRIEIEPDSAPVCAIGIGTKLRRNEHKLGRKTCAALVNCQVVSANRLDWVVIDSDGRTWNVSHHALANGVWEIERDAANVVDESVRSLVEIARQMRGNLADLPDVLLSEFLQHPQLEEIQQTLELADKLTSARSDFEVRDLTANLTPLAKIELWKVLSKDERIAVRQITAGIAPVVTQESTDSSRAEDLSAPIIQHPDTPEEHQPDDVSLPQPNPLTVHPVIGGLVRTVTGAIGVVRYIFNSLSKPFVVYHEQSQQTLQYELGELLPF